MASSINEFILSNLLNVRSNRLREFISQMLNGQANQASASASHIKAEEFAQTINLSTDKFPSYISRDQFVHALYSLIKVDVSQTENDVAKISAAFTTAADKLPPNSPLKDVIKVAASTVSEGTRAVENISEAVGDWYDAQMERLKELYKKHVQVWIFMIGLIISVIFNVDTITIANELLVNPTLREALIEQSQSLTQDGTSPSTMTVEEFTQRLESLQLSIGWPDQALALASQGEFGSWFGAFILKLLGLVITTFAVAQGAPFWFDVVNNVANLRSGGALKKGNEPQDNT